MNIEEAKRSLQYMAYQPQKQTPKTKEITLTIQVPDWAGWIAMDKDGHIFCFEAKPIAVRDLGRWFFLAGESDKYQCIGFTCLYKKNWEDTLQEIGS